MKSYEKLIPGNSSSKSRGCNTLITAVPLSRQILMLPDVSHKCFIRSEFFYSLHILHSFLWYPHKLTFEVNLGTPRKS